MYPFSESALAFGASKPSHTSVWGWREVFAVLAIRTLASQWISLGFSLGIGTTGRRDRPRRRADHAYNHSSELSRDAPAGTMQSAVVWSDA